MTIAFGAIGAKSAGGTTSVAVAHPASVGAGDHLILADCGWPSSAGVNALSGWSVTQLSGGTGTAVDAHTTTVAAFRKEAVGGESGNATVTRGGTPTGQLGVMARYTKTAPSWAAVATATGTDNTHGADRSMTTGATLDLAPGDMVVIAVGVDTDDALTITSPTLTASGITFGTVNRRTSGTGVTTGEDGNVELFDAVVTAGSATVAVTFAFTTTTTQCGSMVITRLREAAITGSGVVTLPALTAAGAGNVVTTGSGAAVLPSLGASGTGTVQTAGEGALALPGLTAAGTGDVRVAGAGDVSLPALAASGSGTVGVTGSGELALPSLQAAGAGEVKVDGQGSVALPGLTAAGTGSLETTGGGDVQLPALAVTGTGTVTAPPGTGALELPALVAVGTGTVSIAAEGVLSLPAFAASAEGDVRVTGSGALALPALQAVGTAELIGAPQDVQVLSISERGRDVVIQERGHTVIVGRPRTVTITEVRP